MAEQGEFLQSIDGAITDADSWELFINGDETQDVLTRLGAEYPSVQKWLKEQLTNLNIAGRYKTLADLQASDLTDGQYALVADDTDDNNGIYIKEGSEWVKSKYDLVTKAIAEHDESSIAEELVDSEGNSLRITTADGKVFLPHLSESLQDSINKRDDDQNFLLYIKDAEGNKIPFLTKDGTLIVSDVITTNPKPKINITEPQNPSTELNPVDSEKMKVMDLKSRDYAIAARDADRLNVEYELATTKEGYPQVGSPVVERIGRNKHFVVIGWANSNNDFSTDSISESFIVSFDDNYNMQKTENKTFLTGGTDERGAYMVGCIQPFYVKEGAHKGRLYVYFIKRYGTNGDFPYYVYSDDEGETWSEEISLAGLFPNYEQDWRLVLVAPAKIIQIRHGQYKGRIVLPCWTGGPGYPSNAERRAFLMYSDDGGETYNIGAFADVNQGNECAVAEADESGKLVMIVRDLTTTKKICYSYDGGETLTPSEPLEDIHSPRIQADMIQASNDFDLTTPKIIITAPYNPVYRSNLGVYISYDGHNFDLSAKLQQGSCMYTTVSVVDESHLFILYEQDGKSKVSARLVNLKEILMGGI